MLGGQRSRDWLRIVRVQVNDEKANECIHRKDMAPTPLWSPCEVHASDCESHFHSHRQEDCKSFLSIE